MTVVDALAEEERTARAALLVKLAALRRSVVALHAEVELGVPPSFHATEVRLSAAREAWSIYAACRHAAVHAAGGDAGR